MTEVGKQHKDLTWKAVSWTYSSELTSKGVGKSLSHFLVFFPPVLLLGL